MGALTDMLFSQLGIDPTDIAKMGKDIGTALADFQQRLTRIEAQTTAILEILQNGKQTGAADGSGGNGTGNPASGSDGGSVS